MEIFFQDPSDIPLPPDEVRIREFNAQPWPDGRRVRVTLRITPFQKKPNGEIRINHESGEEVANISIIETIDPNMELTLHLRQPETWGEYTAYAILYYSETEEAEEKPENGEALVPQTVKNIIVDQAETGFSIEP